MDESIPTSPQPEEILNEQVLPIEQLPASLGFTESNDMINLHVGITEAAAIADRQKVVELTTQYHALMDEMLQSLQGADYERASLGADVARALLRKDQPGRFAEYYEDLGYSLDFAQARCPEAVEPIKQALREARAQLEATPEPTT